MAHSASTQQMTFQVHDTEGHVYSVLFRVDEKAAQGTLMITGSAAGETRQYELTQLQKSRNGKTLGFKSSGATVTLTIEDVHLRRVCTLSPGSLSQWWTRRTPSVRSSKSASWRGSTR